MGYEKPSTKLTFYKAFFSSQWKFLIHTILQSMSVNAHHGMSLAQQWHRLSFACLHVESLISLRKGCTGVETPLFEGMLVAGEPEEQCDAEEELKTRVKKLEKANKIKALKLRRLRKVGTSQRVDTSDDTIIEDVSNQGRMIDELDRNEGVVLIGEKEEEKKAEKVKDITGDAQVKGRQTEIYQIDIDHAAKVLSMQEDEPEVKEVVEVVTTAKLITEVVIAASTPVSVAKQCLKDQMDKIKFGRVKEVSMVKQGLKAGSFGVDAAIELEEKH
nr:hypothetical protein [Tanacetum cinerariifolium]